MLELAEFMTVEQKIKEVQREEEDAGASAASDESLIHSCADENGVAVDQQVVDGENYADNDDDDHDHDDSRKVEQVGVGIRSAETKADEQQGEVETDKHEANVKKTDNTDDDHDDDEQQQDEVEEVEEGEEEARQFEDVKRIDLWGLPKKERAIEAAIQRYKNGQVPVVFQGSLAEKWPMMVRCVQHSSLVLWCWI